MGSAILRQMETLQTLERAEIERHGESTCPCPQVKELIWGQAPSPPDKSLKGYDLVLGSDLFYIPGQAVNFTATLLSIFHTARALGQQNPPLVLLAHGTRADSFHNSFFEEFEKASLTINTVSTVEHDKEQEKGQGAELQKCLTQNKSK